MKLVLLSGGSGKRLWPLSNETRSKQFLKVLEDDYGQKQSMIQRVWSQLKKLKLNDSTIVATTIMQRDMIQNQIGNNVAMIIEPERRDTFSAIALAATYLYSIENQSLDEIVAVLPVDSYVQDSFFNRVVELEQLIIDSSADLALIGVKPTYPSSKYGYIVPTNSGTSDPYVMVDYFTEKPSEEKAESLIKTNALWNCGVFAFKLKYILDLLTKMNISLNFKDLQSSYNLLPKISFDYEVVEKANRVVALAYEGYWKDLGTWNTLTEEMRTNQIGKGLLSDDSTNTHLLNELDIPVTVIGVKNVVVAASPEGILVTDKSLSHKIKELIIGNNYHEMYEERMWGWSRVLDYASYEGGQEMVTKRICIYKGKNSSYHYHNYRDEIWTIVKGEGELALDDSITRVKTGDVIHLPAGKKHGIKAIKDLEFIEVQTRFGISDEDIKRLFYKWEDVLSHL